MFETTRAYPAWPTRCARSPDRHAMALLTNKPEDSARKVLAHCGLDGFFAHMVFGDGEFGRKPDPTGLRWLMRRHRASAKRTILIGDSEVDLAAARAAGVRICLARYGFGFIRVDPASIAGGEWCIDQPLDLLGLLQ